jgi:hypothetical protein
MDKSKYNLRSNFLFFLLAISSFSLFAQKNTSANKATIKTNNDQSGTIQINTTPNNRLILQSSTTDAHIVREIFHGDLQSDNGSTYGDNIHTSAGTDLSSDGNGSQTSSLVNCPMMYVQVNVPFLQSCISSSAQVNYCNQGTATAFGAFVDVELPAELFLDSADLPFTVLGTNLYRFQLGTVLISDCNQFEIYFTTDCDSNLIGEEHCIHANIYPDTLCNSVQTSPLITVDATCIGGEASFTLNNHGTAVTMAQQMQLIIIEDHLLFGGSPHTYYEDTFELESGGTYIPTFYSRDGGYKLQLIDGAGNQLLQSRVNNCLVGSTDLSITYQHPDPFANGGLLPSTSQGCAINGEAAAQTNSTFAPSNNPGLNPNGGANNNTNKDSAIDLEALETEGTTVLVFPNPFSQYTTVRIEGPISDRFMFRLYDATGKTVQMKEIEGQREFQIERGNLLQGMYLYQIESEGKLVDAGKLIIQ